MNFVHSLDFTTFAGAFQWVIAHGMFWFSLRCSSKGRLWRSRRPLRRPGYFDVFIVFILSFLGDIVADVIYYFIGYFSRLAVIEKFGRFFRTHGKTDASHRGAAQWPFRENSHCAEAHTCSSHARLMLVGATKMPIKRFVKICSIIIFPRTIFLVIMGYYFGRPMKWWPSSLKKTILFSLPLSQPLPLFIIFSAGSWPTSAEGLKKSKIKFDENSHILRQFLSRNERHIRLDYRACERAFPKGHQANFLCSPFSEKKFSFQIEARKNWILEKTSRFSGYPLFPIPPRRLNKDGSYCPFFRATDTSKIQSGCDLYARFLFRRTWSARGCADSQKAVYWHQSHAYQRILKYSPIHWKWIESWSW